MLRRLWVPAALAVVVLAIYRTALSAFFYDDDFQWLVTRWAFHPRHLLNLDGYSHFYRPGVELYFWAGSWLFNGSPRAFHAASIGVHVINGWLLFLIAAALGMTRPVAWAAAFLFVVQPAYVEAVAWVGALGEPVGTMFGCAALVCFLRFRRTGRGMWLVPSLAAFTAALFTHESMVVFLPLLGLADLTHGGWAQAQRGLVRVYAPFAIVAAAYLAIDISVNSRHYIVNDGQYRAGLHMVRNVFEYIASLYVGRRSIVDHAATATVLAAVLIWGRPRARFGVAWMVIAIMPFAPFLVADVSRYSYLPAAGLALLLAEGLAVLHERMTRRAVALRHAIVIALAVAIGARFAVFAWKGADGFAERTEAYREYLVAFRAAHPSPAPGTVFPVTAEAVRKTPIGFLEAAVQWEYHDPTLRLVLRDP